MTTATAEQPLPVTPGATTDIGWDWADWLPAGDSIASQAVVAAAGLTLGDVARSGAVVSARITVPSDAAEFAELAATCTITTANGLVDSRRYLLMVSG